MFQNSIIPQKPILGNLPGKDHNLNLEAIAVFAAIGFFLDRDTYWNNEIAIPPATNFTLNNSNELTSEKQYFEWHYSPRNISFESAVDEFSELFESSIKKYINRSIILPLSGGLDSRTIATALKGSENVNAYSYHFQGGVEESRYGREIAKKSGFNFKEFIISSGYLWGDIERLADINQCYAEFTHPRQMYIIDKFKSMGDIILAGHGGDLFFDDMGVSDHLTNDEQIYYLLKKMVRKGGLELADSLWQHWGLKGTFLDYLSSRFDDLLKTIPIDNANSRLRAFKSKYYVPRWTMVNMQIFQSQCEVFAPYFTDEMCRFICTMPEKFLKGRQIQIEYIKRKSPKLAKIPWQAHRPFNLYNYHYDKVPYNLPYRIGAKLSRLIKNKLGEELVQRNWELQFLGEKNDAELKKWLFDNPELNKLVSSEITETYYQRFKKGNKVHWSHPLSMLLTLGVKLKNINLL